jgi:hypothetical protein
MRLTSLHLSIDRCRSFSSSMKSIMVHMTHQLGMRQPQQTRCKLVGGSPIPLQLHLLGCNGALGTAGGDVGSAGCSSSGTAVERNTGLQDLTLECKGRLSDDELAAAAPALPDLRRLEVAGSWYESDSLVGLCGTGLAAFSACRRLRHIVLRNGPDLDGRQLVAQLPQIASLASLQIVACHGVNSSAVAELQAAFQNEHGRQVPTSI